MNKIVKYVFFALTLVLMCCQGGHHTYDARLVEADSVLRQNDPDSALRLLTDIDGGRLPNAADRAYHALLLTQAQYRCYEDITSDSTIDVALDYYQHHASEQEKLTRAYIYKGAVTEVQGNAEAAMACYKQAVSVAAPSDHFNQGYAKMRIGSLYRDNLVADSSDVTILKEALTHFEQVPDSLYILNCLSTIGSCYVTVNNDSAMDYLARADRLAKAIHRTDEERLNLIYLTELKMFSANIQDVEEAKNIALSLISSFPECSDGILLDAAFTLARLNKPDSATVYLNRVDKSSLTDGMLVLYDRCLAEIARCRGNTGEFQHYYDLADQITDSLVTNNLQRQLRDVEAKYDNVVLKNKSLQYRNKWFVSLLIVGLLSALVLALRRRLSSRQRLVLEQEKKIERLSNEAALLASQVDVQQTTSDALKQAIRQQIMIYAQLVDLHSTRFSKSPGKFSKAFERSYLKNDPDSSFWKSLITYANSMYNDIITRSVEEFPLLNKTDINYLTLYCCDLPTSVIMACLGYKEAHSAYNKKRRVSETLGCPNDLDGYVNRFKELKIPKD